MFYINTCFFKEMFFGNKDRRQNSKYVLIIFLLFPTGGAAAIPGEQTIFACKGKALKLSCPKDNEVIKVTRANYGRFSIAVCNDQSMTTWSVNCFSPKAKHVLQSK